MRKHFMKKRVIGLYVMICACMLLFAGCAGTDTDVKATAEEMETSVDQETVPEDTSTSEGTPDTFADANEMLASADLSGTAGGCSDAGCTINTSPFADGSSSPSEDEATKEIVYREETVFQKAMVRSDGGGYSLEDSEKSELKENDFVLCFGNQQEDGTYLADKIIVITFIR